MELEKKKIHLFFFKDENYADSELRKSKYL